MKENLNLHQYMSVCLIQLQHNVVFLYLAHRMKTKLSVLYVSKTNLLKHYDL